MRKVETINQWEGSEHLSEKEVKEFYDSHIDWLENQSFSELPIQRKYWIEATEVENEDDWNFQRCEIHTPHRRSGEMMLEQSVKIGVYKRNYHSFAKKTFYPFHKNGQDYALYSPDYTSTRIMKLPECEDIGGEEPNKTGFCPIEYFVPCNERKSHKHRTFNVDFGFVKGCVWGDDSSMNVQYIDLTNVEKGEIERKPEKLGYHELPENVPLKKAVDLGHYNDDPDFTEWENQISIASYRSFKVDADLNFHFQRDGLSAEKKEEDKEFVEFN